MDAPEETKLRQELEQSMVLLFVSALPSCFFLLLGCAGTLSSSLVFLSAGIMLTLSTSFAITKMYISAQTYVKLIQGQQAGVET